MRLTAEQQYIYGGTMVDLIVELRAEGPLDHAALAAAAADVVARQDALRLRVVPGLANEAEQWFAPPSAPEVLRLVGDARERFLATPLDPATSVLRVGVEDHGALESRVLVRVNHVAIDGWSLELLGREFADAYDRASRGGDAPAPPSPASFEDFARAREEIGDELDEARLRWWADQVRGATPLMLPHDGAASHISHVIARTSFVLQTAQALGTSLPNLIVGATFVAGRIWSGVDNLAMTCVHHGRDTPELSRTIGCFPRPVLLTADLAGGADARTFAGELQRRSLRAIAASRPPYSLANLLTQLMDRRDVDAAEWTAAGLAPLVCNVIPGTFAGRPEDPPERGVTRLHPLRRPASREALRRQRVIHRGFNIFCQEYDDVVEFLTISHASRAVVHRFSVLVAAAIGAFAAAGPSTPLAEIIERARVSASKGAADLPDITDIGFDG